MIRLQHNDSTSRILYSKDVKCGQNQIPSPWRTPVPSWEREKVLSLERNASLSTHLPGTGNKWGLYAWGHHHSTNMYLTPIFPKRRLCYRSPQGRKNPVWRFPRHKYAGEVFWGTNLWARGDPGALVWRLPSGLTNLEPNTILRKNSCMLNPFRKLTI